MSKRLFPALIMLALLFCAQVAQAQPQRTNVLLVLSDDHSAAHVGAFGNPDIKTPNLDKFASQGMRFERAYVAAPQCVPSRAALMTGRSPVALQMTRFSAPLPIEHKTWLELLRAGGWFVGVAGRTYHLDGSALPPESQVVFDKHQLKTFERRLDFVRAGGGGRPIHLGAVAQFREFLDLAPKGKPFALQLCYVFAERGAHGSGLPTGTSPFDLGRVVIGKRYKLIYNALWQLPYQPVDFAGDAFWKELQQMNKDGKLSPLLSRLYFSPTRPMFELFDLEADPNEFNNLIGGEEHAAIERELKAVLQEWMIMERDYLPLPVPPSPAR